MRCQAVLANGAKQKSRRTFVFLLFSAAVGSRTPNLLIRSQVLYPIELRLPRELQKISNQNDESRGKAAFFTIGSSVIWHLCLP